MKDPKSQRGLLILVLGSLTTIGPLSIDMYLPAFGGIARELDTEISRVSLSLSSFFVGLAIGQLIYGPLLERFGRKKPMYIGLIIYALSSLACGLSSSVEELIVFRFFQALGACGGLVASRAIVRDLFDTKDMAKVFSLLMMVIAVSPIIAPTLGGFIATAFGWRYVFGILAGMSLLILTGGYLLLAGYDRINPGYSLRPRAIATNYLSILTDRHFIVYAMTGAFSSAGLYAYISGSPHLYLELFGLNEKQYGIVFAVIAAGLVLATQLNNRVLRNRSSERIVQLALIGQCVIAVLLLVDVSSGFANLYFTTGLIFAYLFCLGFIFPNASALSLDTMRHTAGSASALMGSLQMAVGAVASAIVGILQNETGVPMAGVMAVCGGVALTLLSVGSRRMPVASSAG
ncbi:DHA1 family bicyclomycin/chloramphenicol resistance-like MFS transporter [Lewinella aquimaris]|uniref:DHA1 family bicyclomycin/chloramphenicol resistance-like MFS transporter n=1 Tax=Neolewinella aquimaris TaxID=1835722 RepID=A0A840ED23_9BACT|nr:multidrug effflux MFS transporter [Neolewinella aquimaris]MBB4079878.1 DHA1 family bicyclomycin/chloramphenicol resistance-like MFS transporter [Neolewinella aquimaris]